MRHFRVLINILIAYIIIVCFGLLLFVLMLLLYNFQFHLATVEDIVELSIDSSREEVLQYLMLNYMLYVVFIGRRVQC